MNKLITDIYNIWFLRASLHSMRLFYTLLLALCFSVPAIAGTLSGTVRDTKGNALPFATVFVAGTTNGSAANASGNYVLPLPAGNYIVTCQYIGYQQITYNLNIGADEAVKHDFRMVEQGLEMKEVVVHASDEDPAYRIIREAIKKRSFHLQQVKDFQTSIYMKGVLRTRETPDKVMGEKVDKGEMGLDSAGKGVLYLCEEIADYYSQQSTDKEKTVVHSVKESGDPNGLGWSQLPPVITFYDNNVRTIDNFSPRGHVSPIASNALGFYKYRLEGEFKEGRNVIYKIKVIPKRAYEPLFFGTIYIVEGEWAIHSLSLATSTRYGLDQLDTLRIDQVFLPLKKDTWVIKNQQFYPVISILGFGITGNFVTVYDNQKVNEEIPESVFNRRIVSTYDQGANKKDSSYWEETRPLPLETDEARDYRVKDSLRIALENPQRVDSLRKVENRVKLGEFLYKGMDFNDSGSRTTLHISPLVQSMNFNTVEGVVVHPQFAIRRKLDTPNTLTLRLAPRYSFANDHFNMMGAITYQHMNQAWRGKGWSLMAEGGKYVFQYNRENPVVPLLNTFNTLLFDYNSLKLYERWTGALAFRRSWGNGVRFHSRLAYEHRIPLWNADYYSLSGDGPEKFSSNLPKELRRWHWEEHDAVIARIGMYYQPGHTYVQYPDYRQSTGSSMPTFSAQYERGIPGLLGSNVDWDKWRVGVTGVTNLNLLGSLSYNLSAGGFITKKYVGLPDLKHLMTIDDMEFTFAAPYMKAFQMALFYRFSNDASIYGEAHVEYNMKGLLTNKIPGLRQAQWYFILGNNTFYSDRNLYYSEVFLAIDNLGYKLFRLLRVDFVRGWDSDKRTYTGVRLGLRLPVLATFRGGTADTEW
jgi:hypothetical protein